MLIGELPYDDPDDVMVVKMHLYAPVPSPCDRDASISSDLGEVVRKAMAKRAEDRFSDIAEMRQAFSAAIERLIHTTEDEKELSEFDELIETSPPIRPMSVTLSPQEIGESAPESELKQSRVKQSIYRKVNHNSKHLTLSLIATTLVSLILLVLLLMPRVFDYSIFPKGFPLFGAAPYATVSVVVQSKTVQDTYLLTSSPQISKPNLIMDTSLMKFMPRKQQ